MEAILGLTGRHAVVTGAASGMGLRLAQTFLRFPGTTCSLLDIKTDFPNELNEFDSSRIDYFSGDLTSLDFVQSVRQEVQRKRGRADFLVNSAGVLLFGKDKSILEVDLDIWSKTIDVNLNGVFYMCREFAPLIKETSVSNKLVGSIVNVSTIQCLRGDSAPQDAYQASKAGVIALSKSLSIQLAPDIRVNTLCPGPVYTPLQARWDKNPDALQGLENYIPLKRVGNADDMAKNILFLLSDMSSNVTGIELISDGGICAMP